MLQEFVNKFNKEDQQQIGLRDNKKNCRKIMNMNLSI